MLVNGWNNLGNLNRDHGNPIRFDLESPPSVINRGLEEESGNGEGREPRGMLNLKNVKEFEWSES